MNADQLAEKFKTKIAAGLVEKDKQSDIASANAGKRTADADCCKAALERKVLFFLQEMKEKLGDDQFSFAHQIELNDCRPVGASFTIGNGAPTKDTTAYGNIVGTRGGDSGTRKGIPCVFAPHVRPYISNSGDLARDKMAKLVETVIDHGGA